MHYCLAPKRSRRLLGIAAGGVRSPLEIKHSGGESRDAQERSCPHWGSPLPLYFPDFFRMPNGTPIGFVRSAPCSSEALLVRVRGKICSSLRQVRALVEAHQKKNKRKTAVIPRMTLQLNRSRWSSMGCPSGDRSMFAVTPPGRGIDPGFPQVINMSCVVLESSTGWPVEHSKDA